MTGSSLRRKFLSLMLTCSVFGMLALTGCKQDAIIIPPGTVIVLAEDVKNVDVYAPDKDGNMVKRRIKRLPAGTMIKVALDGNVSIEPKREP